MSALNPIIFTLKNPETPAKQNKKINLSEQYECILEIPSHLLQRAIQSCDTKTELVVYMTILRYSVGFNRSRCTLSRRFISTWTGLQHQNVGRGIEGLISKGLVERLPESNLKHGDVFKINFWSESEMTRNQSDYTQPPKCNQSENTQGVIKMITERNQLDYEASSERLRGVISLITKNKKEEKERSSSVSPKLQKHLESMPQAFQRRAEKQSLSQLEGRYSVAQIENSLEYLLKNGTTSGQKILMPLKYLATDSSMDTVLGIIEKQASEAQRKQLLTQAFVQEEAQHQALEQQRRERESHSQECFAKAFPSEEAQLNFISRFMEQRWRCKSIKPSPNIARKLAIADWYKTQFGEAK
ncbi:MAG: hypothetical protein R3A80_10100 [Bdellovibrionota bacterium]